MISVTIAHDFGRFSLDIGFSVPAVGCTVLFGPSGAGKSLTLGAIGGTRRLASERIVLGHRLICDSETGVRTPPHRRCIGSVDQDARLFPHMTVQGNLTYGAQRCPAPPRIALDDVVNALGLGALLTRGVANLSGGERQRVALGRALLSQPDLLLLDEPLAALDSVRKADGLALIAEVKTRFAVPMIYVTHDAREVRALADHIVLIESGRVIASGPASTLIDRIDPGTQALVIASDDHATIVTIGGVTYTLPPLGAQVGDLVTISPHRNIAG